MTLRTPAAVLAAAIAAATLTVTPAQAAPTRATAAIDRGVGRLCHHRHHHFCIDPGYDYQHGSHHGAHHGGASHRGHR